MCQWIDSGLYVVTEACSFRHASVASPGMARAVAQKSLALLDISEWRPLQKDKDKISKLSHDS